MADLEKKQAITQASRTGAPGVADQAMMTDERKLPIAQGQIPQDSEGIVSGSYDPLDPTGQVDISYTQGNYKQIQGLPKLVADKIQLLTQTFVPLIEVALVELLGSTNMYKRVLGQVYPSFDNKGQMSLQYTFQYSVPGFLGSDIDIEALQHDSNYILNKLKVTQADITKCEINCAEGIVTIQGNI